VGSPGLPWAPLGCTVQYCTVLYILWNCHKWVICGCAVCCGVVCSIWLSNTTLDSPFELNGALERNYSLGRVRLTGLWFITVLYQDCTLVHHSTVWRDCTLVHHSTVSGLTLVPSQYCIGTALTVAVTTFVQWSSVLS